jgi:signal transduction histidine kinase
VERHGGHIELKSVVAEGTTFKIVLPIDSQRPAAAMQGDRTPAEVR